MFSQSFATLAATEDHNFRFCQVEQNQITASCEVLHDMHVLQLAATKTVVCQLPTHQGPELPKVTLLSSIS